MRRGARFLADPAIARATDNQVCRLLLHGDPRIPDADFIDPGHMGPVASAARARLDRFGFVGILESGDAAWEGVSRLFGVALAQKRFNVSSTRETVAGMEPLPPSDAEAVLDRLARCSAADRVLYETTLAQSCGSSHEEARRLADDAFARQLGRLDQVSDGGLASLVRAAGAGGGSGAASTGS